MGTLHYPPNAEAEYDYENKTEVKSEYENWTNYPNFVNDKRTRLSQETWNCDEECKKDNEAFLFSMDFRKKYDIKKGAECAIYCNREYGPTFGEGFDLCLCDNYMGVNGSYSNFPTSYGKGNATYELTGKNPYFRIVSFVQPSF